MANVFGTARAERACIRYIDRLTSVSWLIATLSGPDPFTLFVPIDAAFDRLSAGHHAALSTDPGTLASIAMYSIVQGKKELELPDTEIVEKGPKSMTQRIHLVVPVSERDHRQGPDSATITLVQYGDYECPYTRRSTWVVQALQQELGEQMRFVYRNFPLIEIHPHALHAAFAAEAAAAQGKFWEMHDYIFHHQHTLEDADLAQFAEAVGLDMQQYTHDMAEERGLARIEEDVESGERSGVQGTPTFFTNGVLYRGFWEHDPLLAALHAAGRSA